MISAAIWAALILPQPGVDSRWEPWLGCFRLMGDEIRMPIEPASDASDLFEEAEAMEARSPAPARVCLTPDATMGGVRVQTFADGEAFLEDILVADGERRPVDEGSCAGWQRSEWSSDGERLYTKTELTCEEGRQRRVTGISLFVHTTWVEIQAVGTGSQDARSVQVRRYRSVDEDEAAALSGLSPETLARASQGRLAIAARLATEDVIEAARLTDTAAVEAAVMEVQSRFALDARALGELSDAGVSPALIDLMVALSFPERFVIGTEEDDEGGGGGGGGFGYRRGYYGGYDYDPYWGSALAYPYYYAPFGYYYWYAPYHPVYGVRPIPSSGASVGRVIQGRGYANVNRRPSSTGGRYATPRSGSGGSGDSGDAGVSSSGSSGSASPSGYSKSGGSGRSAKPKKR